MKKLYNIGFLFLLLSFSLFSCGSKEDLFPKFGEKEGQTSVAFTSSEFTVAESTEVTLGDGTKEKGASFVSIDLVRRGTDISAPLTVSISFTATYPEESSLVSEGEDASDALILMDDLEQVTFDANSAYASFDVRTVENSTAEGDVEVKFVISSVSDDKYQIGEQIGKARSEAILTIEEDDEE